MGKHNALFLKLPVLNSKGNSLKQTVEVSFHGQPSAGHAALFRFSSSLTDFLGGDNN